MVAYRCTSFLVVQAGANKGLQTTAAIYWSINLIFELCGSSYRDRQTIAFSTPVNSGVCVVKIIKTLEQLSPCFVSNLCDDHNPLRLLTHVDKE